MSARGGGDSAFNQRGPVSAGVPHDTLTEWWEKPGRMEDLERRFKPDGLLRLARSSQDYYDSHGHYLPGVAVLAMHYQAELTRVSRDKEMWSRLAHENAHRGDDLEGELARVSRELEDERAAHDIGMGRLIEAQKRLARVSRERDDYKLAAAAEAQLVNEARREHETMRDALREIAALPNEHDLLTNAMARAMHALALAGSHAATPEDA